MIRQLADLLLIIHRKKVAENIKLIFTKNN